MAAAVVVVAAAKTRAKLLASKNWNTDIRKFSVLHLPSENHGHHDKLTHQIQHCQEDNPYAAVRLYNLDVRRSAAAPKQLACS